MANVPTILFFDSGVGGLSVYREVKALLPDCHYLYCLDNACFPYSEKTEKLIEQRCVAICKKIAERERIDLIVIACNTASTIVLPAMRENFSCPIVGTVPAIKPAAQKTQTKVIGLLATKGTIIRSYVDDLIKEYAQDCEVKRLGSTELVEIAEQKLHGKPADHFAVMRAVSEWRYEYELDTVILGCTHFPLLKAELKACLPQVSYFIDSGKAIAKRVQSLLPEFSAEKIKKEQIAYCTAPFVDHEEVRKMFDEWGFKKLQRLNEILP
ncbi:glutamate racemase [Gallibacterium salpingitidis]|uniref:glutamate racemase n=1 Tax=Gallibacterium salpingitidis TaxID=505341 RepID=UPI00080587C2|nr:glutamate racemase [Gallibacterium salpingitidis]OBX06978.1 glutamate racemase [Gallibacterium salpingitidis]